MYINNKLPFEKLRRKVIVKQKADPSKDLPGKTDIASIEQLLNYGIINIDKPAGITSYKTAERVKRILHIKKTGHGGTLDPLVTGVLPVALGYATRITQAFLPAGKEYVCTMHLHKPATKPQIEHVFETFTGIIEQVPPVKSAVRRQKREREIYYIEALKIEDRNVTFRVGCQGGTYIRKLVHDMGLALGTGAHMAELRRTKSGCFTEAAMCTLEELAEAYKKWAQTRDEDGLRTVIQPIENSIQHLGKVWIHESVIEPICDGWDVAVPGIMKLHSNINEGELVAVMTMTDKFIALGDAVLTSEEMNELQKGISVKVKKVFMKVARKNQNV